MTELGERIREERLRSGLSQTALAGEEFSPSYISLIESGRREPSDAALQVFAERLETTADYLRFGDKAPSEERARLEIGFARLALTNGEAQQALDRLLELDLSTISPRHRRAARIATAQAYEMLGDLNSSIAILEPMVEEAIASRRSLEAAVMGIELVASYNESGDLNRSIEVGEEVLAAVEAQGIAGTDEHLRLASTILWSYYERGDLLYATHRASELISVADDKGSMRGRGSIYWNAAIVAEGRGDLVEATRLTERALAYLSEGAASRDIPRLRLHYAWLLLRSDPPEPRMALDQLDAAMRDLDLIGSEIDMARCEFESGRAHLILGDPRRAEDFARAGLERLDQKAAPEVCSGRLLLGDALAAQGRVPEARDSYHWAADMFGMLSAGREAAKVWRSLGDRMMQYGDSEGAAMAFEAALREAGIRATTFPISTPLVEAAGFSEERELDR
jgi:transcriptional regulator with XRE-family HTH domain